MNLPEIIISQYAAALAMLEQAITRCPDSLWDSPDDKTKYWHIAYHALFYTHLYLQDSMDTLRPWSKYRQDYHLLGPRPAPPYDLPQIGEPYSKDDLLEYLAFCEQQVAERVPALDLAGESGFYWLPFSKLELQIYTIRHIQQHAGELMDRLGTRANVECDWVGMVHA